MPEFKERRFKKIRIAPELIVEFMRAGRNLYTVASGLPADATFADCRTYAEYAYGIGAPPWIEILVFSKEFPIVPEGNHAPELNITLHSKEGFDD